MKTLRPAAGPLRGAVRVPGDKSIGHRALILGFLAEGGLKIANLPNGEDVRSTARCIEALKNNGAGGLYCGNSGTTMRLLMGVLAGSPREAVLTGDASLSRRPMARVAEPLRAMGAEVALAAGGVAPVTVRGKRPLAALRYRLPVPSAQVKSAVLLAGLAADGETIVEDPFGTRDHTERMLAWIDPGRIRRENGAICLRPGTLPGGKALTVPGDVSSAAFFLAAACAVEGSEILLPGVGINPTRTGFVEILREMGARIVMENRREEAGEPVADLRASHARLRAARVPASRAPSLIDEAPLLAVVASFAEGTTRIEGLGELSLKESDRLAGAAAALLALGAAARVDGDALEVCGPARLNGAAVETLGDHRLAMAFAVAALAAQGETILSDAGCAAVSYPGFFEDLGMLGSGFY